MPEQDGAKGGMVVEILPAVRVGDVGAGGPGERIRTTDVAGGRVDAARNYLSSNLGEFCPARRGFVSGEDCISVSGGQMCLSQRETAFRFT